jgi:glycosyltransferase involved in cell wall biosynthesis
VIIPAFNAEATIDEAVRSALAQTVRELEVIVVDDASTDGTAARVAELARLDARVRLLRHDRNRGAGAARNTGMDAARGAWLAPVDADDALEPDRFERLCARAEATGADLVADNLRFDDGDGAPAEHAFAPEMLRDSPLTVAALVRSDMPRNGLCSFGYLKPALRRDFVERHGLRYDERLFMTEDFHLFVSAVLLGGRFEVFDWAGYRYRRRAGSMSRAPERFERNLRAAAEGSRLLAERAARSGRPADVALLRRHRIAIELTLWLDRVKRAVRHRHWRAAWREVRAMPRYPAELARLLAARIAAGARHTPTARPLDRVRSGSARSQARAPV